VAVVLLKDTTYKNNHIAQNNTQHSSKTKLKICTHIEHNECNAKKKEEEGKKKNKAKSKALPVTGLGGL
jgi:hypothetical protein